MPTKLQSFLSPVSTEEKEEKLIWHYTSMQVLLDMLEGKTGLYATHIRFLNDKVEFKYGLEQLRKIYTKIAREKRKQYIDEKTLVNHGSSTDAEHDRCLINDSCKQSACDDLFVTCFSNRKDDLSMWRSYTPVGGVCIGFRQESLINNIFKGVAPEVISGLDDEINYLGLDDDLITAFGKCQYNPDWLANTTDKTDLFGIKTLLDRINHYGEADELAIEHDMDELRRKLTVLCAFTKHPSFAAEDEIRIALTGNELYPKIEIVGGKPRVPITGVEKDNIGKFITNVVISPHGDSERNLTLVKLYAKKLGVLINVEPSLCPYNGR